MNYFGDTIIEKLGGHGKYQIILALNLFLLGTCSDFYYCFITLMETPPVVEYYENGEKIISIINYDICKKNYTIIENLTKNTWVYELDIYCDKLRTSILGCSICFGSLIGAIAMRWFKNFGCKKCLIIFSLMICVSTPLLFFSNYYVFLFCNLFFGWANIALFMIRNTILTEITDNKYRSHFMNVMISTGILSNLLTYFLFSENIEWRWVYSGNAIALFVFLIFFIFFSVENPRFYHLKKNMKGLVESTKTIAKINATLENVEDLLNNVNNEKNENLITEKEIESPVVTDNPNQNEIKYKLFRFIIMFFAYVNLIMTITFEIKNYSNSMNDLLYYLITSSMFISYIILAFMMNIPILGRKYTVILTMIILIIIKITKITVSFSMNVLVILFLISRLILFSSQIPLHTFLTESFTTKERLQTYGYLYISGKIAALFAPFLLEYLSVHAYDYLLIGLALIVIIMIIQLKETLNQKLLDK
jgi:hypothetical protein